MRHLRNAVMWVGGCALLVSGCGSATKAKAPSPLTAVSAAPAHGCARLRSGGAKRLGAARESATVALARGPSNGAGAGRVIAYVADADEATLHTVDVDARREIATTPLRGKPEQVLVLADGRVAVALRAVNAIEVLEPAEREDAPLITRCAVDTPTEPVSLAATPNDDTVLVASGWAHALSAYDAASFAPKFQVSLPRDPRSVVVSDDGARAFVAHVVDARLSVVDLATAAREVRRVELGVRDVDDSPDATRKGCQGFALAKVASPAGGPAGKMIDRVFAPMVSVNPGDGSDSSEGYGGGDTLSEIGEVAVVDASAERSITRSVRLASGAAHTECLLPRAAVYGGGVLYVTCLGIDALLALDARSADPARAELRRWQVAAGPTGIALDEAAGRAVVWSQFDREIAVVPLRGDEPIARLSVARKADGITSNIALGRRLFHQTGDQRISSDGRACASCHPDGREDALTWSTPDGARQTPMLAGRLASTAPYGWTGGADKLEEHVTKTFQRLSGEGLPKAELAALVDYIGSMAPPIERAVPRDAARQTLVSRGRELFHSASVGCGTCHVAESAFVDGLRHDIEIQPSHDPDAGFDTPSLRFVAGTAPYFHDGRYKSLDEVLIAPDHAMGQSTRLSRQDRAALVSYLETL